jgi:hypothetical protein
MAKTNPEKKPVSFLLDLDETVVPIPTYSVNERSPAYQYPEEYKMIEALEDTQSRPFLTKEGYKIIKSIISALK